MRDIHFDWFLKMWQASERKGASGAVSPSNIIAYLFGTDHDMFKLTYSVSFDK